MFNVLSAFNWSTDYQAIFRFLYRLFQYQAMDDWQSLLPEQVLGGMDLIHLMTTMTMRVFVVDLPINGNRQMVDVVFVEMDGLKTLDSMKHQVGGLQLEPLLDLTQLDKQ